MNDDYVSQLKLAECGNVMPTTLRKNIRILLKMALLNGYSLKKEVADKMEKQINHWGNQFWQKV